MKKPILKDGFVLPNEAVLLFLGDKMTTAVKTSSGSYDIVIERGALGHAGELLSLSRRVLIVTDDGVPRGYAERVVAASAQPYILTLPQGESSKSVENWQELLAFMLEHSFSRSDCAVAVGGGVVGDLTGFAAACYMRGIDFYNIPTTVLSQVDSSVGGKTAIDFHGIKNPVGAFYPPKKVIIDPDVLGTLERRQIACGLAEALKMALTSDAELFTLFETCDPFDRLDDIIERAVGIKKSVVEADEREAGLRRVLNFGHTLGHGIEACTSELYHGECVALGMLPMCSEKVRRRLIPVLRKLGLPTDINADGEKIYEAVTHDKKTSGGNTAVVTVDKPGSFEIKNVPTHSLRQLIAYYGGGER